ncbi:MAG: polyphosphate--glucose phosphotransferase [Saprospiraceae bacterium]
MRFDIDTVQNYKMELLGIDIGGSGIKAAIVDVEKGELISERHRIPTPRPAVPEAIVEVIAEMVTHFDWKGAVGVCFPTVVVDGKALSKSNMDAAWLNFQVDQYFQERCGLPFYVVNDADAAAMAEMKFGAGREKNGVVIVITVGTGLGSGVFHDGKLLPNIELGHVFGVDGKPIEHYAADSARKREGLKFKEWAKRFDFFLHHVIRVFRPDTFIIGGGTSKKMDKFQQHLTIDVPIYAAEKLNNAGIIGAAMFANEAHH